VKLRLLVPLALLLLAVSVLAGCGGGGSSDEGEIVAAIEKAATTNAAGNCTKLETKRFVEQNTAEKGAAAIKTCEKEAKEGAEQAEGAKVSKVAIDGEKATAVVEFEGGPLSSQSLNVGLVDEGGWKLDHIDGFASYDGKALAAAFEKSFEEEPAELKPSVAKCISKEIEGASESEAEELFLGGSTEALIGLIEECAA
jgi:hypothetical protein